MSDFDINSVSISNVLNLPKFSGLAKTRCNALYAMRSLRSGARKCVSCKSEFYTARNDSKAKTCSKSCAALLRDAGINRRKLYRARYETFKMEGFYG